MSDEARTLEEIFAAAEEKTRSGVKTSRQDPTKYSSPDSQFLDSGRSIGSVMPSQHGLKGVVVPRATMLGGSMGYNPNQPAKVVIDPGSQNWPSFELDLNTINKEDLVTAMQSVDVADAVNSVTEEEEVKREIASRAFRKLAVMVENRKSGIGTEVMPSRGLRKVPRAQPEASYTPSTTEVTFEIEGFGEVDVKYHHVSHDSNFFIVAYDTSIPTDIRFMPPKVDKSIFALVPSLEKVFRVRSEGIRFSIANLDVCVLLIEEVVNKKD